MFFPWHKYEEIQSKKVNTLQIFTNTSCNLNCRGCFARNVMENKNMIDIKEYENVICNLVKKGGEKVNILGGEPSLHPLLKDFVEINNSNGLKTTIYTNGFNIHKLFSKHNSKNFENVKLRISIYNFSFKDGEKSLSSLSFLRKEFFDHPIEICFMVSAKTTAKELLMTAQEIELFWNCKVFFISSLREMDNDRKEFFDDTDITMPVMKYKELVHNFLCEYNGNMEIHISKRGVFESTLSLAENKCRFANYICGGKIIQCPYDLVNLKFQNDYMFNERRCQQNSTCLMSKIIVKKK